MLKKNSLILAKMSAVVNERARKKIITKNSNFIELSQEIGHVKITFHIPESYRVNK